MSPRIGVLRVTNFSHAVHGAPDRGAIDNESTADLQILEIQIVHRMRLFDAFHESLLS